nr:restriction endonuclease subunit S [Gluconobacter oxydans]
MLPEGWDCKNINEIGIQVIDGDRGKNYPKDNEFQATGSCLFLSAKNVTKAGFDFSLGQFITSEKHKILNKGAVELGDIVITTRGSIGHFAYYNQKKYQTIRINSGMAILRSNVNYINPDFLYEVCRSQIIKTQIEKASFGSAQPQLTIAIIKKFRIPLPPLSEQKKIAAILSTWDRAIEGTEKLLANSQQQKKALMQQLLTGKKRLPGFSGKWLWKRSKEIFKSISIKNNPMDCELLSVTQDQGVVLRSLLERRVVMPDGSVQGYKLVNPGNFIISLRSFQGGLEYSYYRGLVSPAYTVLDNKIEIENDFYKFYFKSYNFIGHLAVATIGIRDGKQISYQDFSFIKLPYPPLPEQQAIAAVLTTADEEITAIESDLVRLRQEKKALMQQLLTGKRRVTVD